MRPHVLVVRTCLWIACGTDTATPDATEVDSVAPDTIVEADVAAGADAADASETDAAERDVTDTNDAVVEVADPPKIDGIGVDLDLLVPYLRDHSPLAPPTDPRILLP